MEIAIIFKVLHPCFEQPVGSVMRQSHADRTFSDKLLFRTVQEKRVFKKYIVFPNRPALESAA
jgi:hypothetical protein